MKNIYLVGMRGSGKSTVGKLLAYKLGRPFVDLDDKVKEAAGMAIHAIVNDQGWDNFRQLEHEAVQAVFSTTGNIVATGGGVLMYFDNADQLKSSGTIVFLSVDPFLLSQRLEGGMGRPSLTGLSTVDEVESVWKERRETYEKYADHIVQADQMTPEEVAEKIIQALSLKIS